MSVSSILDSRCHPSLTFGLIHLGLSASSILEFSSTCCSSSDVVFVKRVQVLDDWRFIALVIDRLLLYIYAIATVGATLAILTQAPHIFESFSQDDFKLDYKKHHVEGIKATMNTMYNCSKEFQQGGAY